MVRLLTRLLVVSISCGALQLSAGAANADGTSIPGAPGTPVVYAGVDGILMYWAAPSSTGGGLNGYEVQRSSSPSGPFSDLVFVPVASPRQYMDPASSGETWSYRIEAVNDAGTSAPSSVSTVTVPAPVAAGTDDGLTIDALDPNSPWNGGMAFPSDQVGVTSFNADSFSVRGLSDASSPQGARDVTLILGSVVGSGGSYSRPVAGTTYATAASFGAGWMYVGSANGYPLACNGGTGTVHVDEASFMADGTPLVFAATYSLCGGGQAVVRWKASSGVGPAMTAAPAPYDFGGVPVGGSASRTFVLQNAGEGDETLGTAGVTDRNGAPSGSFALGTDACSGTTLTPGSTCMIEVVASPQADARTGLLVVPDGTAVGKRNIGLSVFGVTKPGAPTVQAIGLYGSVRLDWGEAASNYGNGGYTVYRGAAANALSVLAQVAPTQLTDVSYTDTTAVVGQTYYYSVSATNLAGEGAQSAPVSAVAARRGILFSTNEWSGSSHFQIGVVTADGWRTQLTSDNGDHDTPTSSPDGTAFAYTCDCGNAVGDYDLWSKQVKGPALHLTTGATTADGEPSWSPDGKLIAFTRIPIAGGATSVWLVPSSGGTAKQIPGTTGESSPSWSPNGQLLVVSHDTNTGSYLVVTNVYGTYRRTVTGTLVSNHFADSPAWSPQGTSIGFVRSSATSSWVSVVPASGGAVTDLTDGLSDVWDVSWSPVGDRLLFEAYENGYSGSIWSVGPTGKPSAGLVGGANSGYDQSYPSGIEPRATYSPLSVPASVTGVSVLLSNGSAKLTWTRPASAAYVVVRRSLANGVVPAAPSAGVAVYAGAASSVVATGLVNGSAYRFAVFTISSVGDVGSRVSRLVQPAAVPSVTPSGQALLSALYASGPRFTARWGAALPAGQVYEVQIGTRRLSGGVWSAPVYSAFSSGTATSKVVSAAQGVTYYLRARVKDSSGDATAWSVAAVAPVPFDDRAMAAAGTWTSSSALTSMFMSTLRSSKTPKSNLTLRTYGSRFTLIGERCTSCGQFRVYVDGVLKATVSSYSTANAVRQQLWTIGYSTIGLHTVAVYVVGTAGHPYVRIDGLAAWR